MVAIDPFEGHPVLDPSILRGVHLLEADAGSGKTWTLSGLIVRALIERELAIDAILVVTFTKAAVAELKGRVRSRLLEMQSALSGAQPVDPFVQAYRARIETGQVQGLHGQTITVAHALQTLRLALARSDELAAYTLHGFCQRLLSSQPLLAGTSAQLSPQPANSGRIEPLIRRWWTGTLTSLPDGSARLLLGLGLSIGRLVVEVGRRINDRDVERIRRVADWRASLSRACRQREPLAHALAQSRDSLLQWAEQSKHGLARLNGNVIRLDTMRRHLEALGSFAADVSDGEWPAEALAYVSLAHLVGRGRGDQSVLSSVPLPALCETLHQFHVEELNPLLGELVEAAAQSVGQSLSRQIASDGVVSFDDLVRLSAVALDHPERGPALAESLRREYPLALVDECQDTDPMQWHILRRVWTGQPAEETGLVMVGDPKQSIYRFRGADIHAYLQARSHWTGEGEHKVIPRRHRLGENQRSTPLLVAAVNAVFGPPNSFAIAGLEFVPAQAADRLRAALSGGPDNRAPLTWAGSADKMTAPGVARACAREVAALLGPAGARLADAPLAPADIAILVSTNDQGAIMKKALLEYGIASVETTRARVFESDEADELLRVLAGIAYPDDAGLLRAALCTRLMGIHINDVEDRLSASALQFEGVRQIWQSEGPRAALQSLFSQAHSAARLASGNSAQRRLTNLAHLLDLLDAAEVARSSAMAGLNWLRRARDDGETIDASAEETELRLENDQGLVRILTLHRCKGLEFPVVFVPFAWNHKGRAKGNQSIRFHELTDRWRSRVDLSFAPEQSAIDANALEEQAERLRLLYVAMTRAIHRCYLVGPPPMAASEPSESSVKKSPRAKVGGGSPIDYLLALRRSGPQVLSGAPFAWIPLDQLGGGFTDAQLVAKPKLEAIEPRLARLQRTLPPVHRTSSFSGIIARALGADAQGSVDRSIHDARDRDQIASPLTPESVVVNHGHIVQRSAEQQVRYDFPAGVRAGGCLHQMLERADFQLRPDAARLAESMSAWGIVDQSAESVADWLQALFQADLNQVGLKLANVASADRLIELEFNLRVAGLDNAALMRAVAAHEPLAAAYLLGGAGPAWSGLLHGFIDLVFRHDDRYYVLDWKSNHLGHSREHYGHAAMTEAIATHGYALQYSLYLLALHRFLKVRLPHYDPARHLGGVYYLFIRAVGDAPGPNVQSIEPDPPEAMPAGVFHRPANLPLVHALDTLFDAHTSPGQT